MTAWSGSASAWASRSPSAAPSSPSKSTLNRGWDLLRIATTILLVGNLAIPAVWAGLWLLR